MNRRFLFVRLPYFPVELFHKQQRESSIQQAPWWDEQASQKVLDSVKPKGTLVLVHNGAKGTRISALGPDALKLGLWPDMKLADARAMIPDVQVEQHDLTNDREKLQLLARWLMRYSPAVSIYGDDGFLLDTTGCDHLFGDERQMANNIATRLQGIGFSTRLAFSDTMGASIALVNHGANEIHILPPGHADNFLDALPVEALRLDADCVTLLYRLGLKRIGDVRLLPRSALERRFRDSKGKTTRKEAISTSQSVQWRLDQLSGVLAEPLEYISEPDPFRISLNCPDLALGHEAVGMALDQLLPGLCTLLTKAGCGGRHFKLVGYRADGGTSWVNVALSQPAQTPQIIARLFKDKLDHIDCGYGIDLFTLSALGIERFGSSQHDMIDTDAVEYSSASITAFADIMANRAGPQTVTRLAPHVSHVPERAQRLTHVSTLIKWDDWKEQQPVWSPRPLRLFTRPEPAEVTAELPDSPPAQFVWRRVLRRVVRSRGPECIMPEWWHDSLKSKRSATFRDYYDVEDSEGLRYWIFRSIKEERVEVAEPTIANDNSGGEVLIDSAAAEARKPESITTISWFVHGLF